MTKIATIAERYRELCDRATTKKLRKMLVHTLESDENDFTRLYVISYFLASSTPFWTEVPDPSYEKSNRIASDVINVLVSSPKASDFECQSRFKPRKANQEKNDPEILRIDELLAPKTVYAKDSAIISALDAALQGTIREETKPDPTIYHKFWACSRFLQLKEVPVFFGGEEWRNIEAKISRFSPEVRLAEVCCANEPPRDYAAERNSEIEDASRKREIIVPADDELVFAQDEENDKELDDDE